MEEKLKPHGWGEIVRFKIIKHHDLKTLEVTNKPNVGLCNTWKD